LMKKIYIILLSLLMISSLACNDIAVDAKNIKTG
jgi:hypothetical protein